MKSILIISKINLAYGNTAASARMLKYALALSQIDDNKVYLLSRDEYTGALVETYPSIYTFGKNDTKNKLPFFRFIHRLISTLKEEIVILYYPAFNPLFELKVLLNFRIIKRIPIFCELNEVRKYDSSLDGSDIKTFIKKFMFSIFENTARLYNGLICISTHIAEYYKSKNKNILIVPILSDDCPPPPKKICQLEDIKFVFTGTISFTKENLLEVFQAFKLLKKDINNWHFSLYGFITTKELIYFNEVISSMSLSDKITYNGILQHSNINSILYNADCLLLTRKNTLQNYYGFSTKLSEYATSGTPIIMTDTGVVKEYFKDNFNCLMFDGYTKENYYSKLKAFIYMTQEQRERLSSKAYDTAMNCFCWKNYIDKLNNFLINS